jgi:hypothetical protein
MLRNICRVHVVSVHAHGTSAIHRTARLTAPLAARVRICRPHIEAAVWGLGQLDAIPLIQEGVGSSSVRLNSVGMSTRLDAASASFHSIASHLYYGRFCFWRIGCLFFPGPNLVVFS